MVVTTRTGIVHAETRTGVPERLHQLLERVGFTRHAPTPVRVPAPTYVFHTLPADTPPAEARLRAARATGYAFAAGFKFIIEDGLRDDPAGQDAYDEYRGRRTHAAGTPPTSRSTRPQTHRRR